MENFLSGGIEELKAAKDCAARLARLTAAMEESEKLLKANDKEVSAQRKFMADKIEAAIRNRRGELEKAHDDQLSIAQRDLRSAEKNRKSAKSKAVSDRITGETEHLNAANKKLNTQINQIFRKAKIPTLCNTAFYFALFHARTVKDFLIFALTVLAAIAVIPNVVCALLNVSTVVKILIYVGIIIVFLAIYFALLAAGRSSEAKITAFEKAYQLRKRIAANKKQIKALSSNIRGDKDESSYGLEGYDADIQRCQAIVDEAEEAKEAALSDFDEYTAGSVRTEIENESLPAIEQLEADGKALKSDFLEKQEAAQKAKTELADKYAAYLGAENASEDKIDELITIISDGRAETIMQALDVLNGENK